MSGKTVLILERSSQNLKKISKDGRTVLEGVFAEFGVENRNGRVYEEREYLPHLEYLKKDIENGNLLGELDHPERFEVSLGNVSHKISELWYDQGKRQILGRIEVLDGTPKGQIAKSLLDAGIPLSISSRAAGSVNEDKTVRIEQIYTYDLVAKPGFESAELHEVNESANADPKMKRIATLLESFNNSSKKQKEDCINDELGIINENISIIDVTDKFPSVKLREEAKSLIQKNKEIMEKTNVTVPSGDKTLNEWTVKYNGVLEKLSTRLANIENAILETNGVVDNNGELKTIKSYIEKIRKIQESTINWQEDIAKNVNKIGNYADTLAKKSNKHYDLTKKIVETVDYNAKTLNATQDWVGNNAEVTNLIGESVDHNAHMLNSVNEWTESIAKSVNRLNEWGEEKAGAINDINEWTESIAKNLNCTAEYAETMLGRAMSKKDAKKLVEYIEIVAASKKNPKLKEKINEMLEKHEINEATLKSGEVLDSDHIEKNKNWKVDDIKGIDSVKQFAEQNGTKQGESKGKAPKNVKPKVLNAKVPVQEGVKPKVLDAKVPQQDHGGKIVVGKSGKKFFVLDTTKVIGKGENKNSQDGPTGKMKNMQNLKLDQKASGKLKEEKNIDRTLSIKTRSSKLDERLNKIVKSLEKERTLDEEIKSQYPFTQLLSAKDRNKFGDLSESDKQKVSRRIMEVPTTESEIIKKLWENTLASDKQKEPLWLELAPVDFKKIYEKAPEQLKESIKARTEYYRLETKYQIDNFWQTSGLKIVPTVTLNEDVVATKTNKDLNKTVDPLVEAVINKMETYN
jgi:hypothetical protein